MIFEKIDQIGRQINDRLKISSSIGSNRVGKVGGRAREGAKRGVGIDHGLGRSLLSSEESSKEAILLVGEVPCGAYIGG